MPDVLKFSFKGLQMGKILKWRTQNFSSKSSCPSPRKSKSRHTKKTKDNHFPISITPKWAHVAAWSRSGTEPGLFYFFTLSSTLTIVKCTFIAFSQIQVNVKWWHNPIEHVIQMTTGVLSRGSIVYPTLNTESKTGLPWHESLHTDRLYLPTKNIAPVFRGSWTPTIITASLDWPVGSPEAPYFKCEYTT